MIDLGDKYDNKISQWWLWFEASCQAKRIVMPEDERWKTTASKVWLASEFVRQRCIEQPQMLADLISSGELFRAISRAEFYYLYRQRIKMVRTPDQLKPIARYFRVKMTFRLVWRDVSGWSPLREVIRETSDCADVVIDCTNKLLYRWLSRQRTPPPYYQGRPAHLLVIAVGKLGGVELNLSSDVDLIFCYMSPHDAHDVAPVEVDQFYQILAKQLIEMLNQVTCHGIVYRVDLRLRPFGSSGPLVSSSQALQHYYQDQASEWERYAMLKARVISGDPRAALAIARIMESFVYRSYLDYATIESLRQLHALWSREGKRRNVENNIKLGVGGIREIEFIVQNIQLTRGGPEPRLRQANLLSVLSVIEQEGLLPADTTRVLEKYYIFFRLVENRLQAFYDTQVHTLPDDSDKQWRLANTLGFDTWEKFDSTLSRYHAITHDLFRKFVFRSEVYEHTSYDIDFWSSLNRIWMGHKSHHELQEYIDYLGYDQTKDIVSEVLKIHKSDAFKLLSKQSRTALLKLISIFLTQVKSVDGTNRTIKRVLSVLMSLMQRKAYLVLLLENIHAIQYLIRLCHACPWMADQIMQYPVLLGELIDEQRLHEAMTVTSLKRKLLMWLRPVAHLDESEQMRVVAHFKLLHVFRVVAMDVLDDLPIAQVSNYLSFIAEIILQHVQRLAWRRLLALYGRPPGVKRSPQFLIVAYGKLGGLELGYASDLDLVFLYQKASSSAKDGAVVGDDSEMSAHQFYTKMAQKIISMVNYQTVMGPLYTVDTRLRPLGESGMLVSHLDAFEEYQRTQAWVWEHQALVRARVVSGPADLRSDFYGIRKSILRTRRDAVVLWGQVSEMRQKMLQATKATDKHLIHLKQTKGCMNDIEFMVQYLVLSAAADYPSLVNFTDNIRLLEVIGRVGLLQPSEAKILYDAFLAYRAMIHKLDLQQLSRHTIASTKFRAFRAAVQGIWQQLCTQEHDNGSADSRQKD